MLSPGHRGRQEELAGEAGPAQLPARLPLSQQQSSAGMYSPHLHRRTAICNTPF